MKPAIQWTLAALALAVLLATGAVCRADSGDWAATLKSRIESIDGESPARLGVHVRHLGDGKAVSHRADRPWYLASTVKIPLAVAIMQRVEDGKLSLEKELELQESDWVDGSGELLYKDPGARFSVDELIGRSLRDSDSSATDMLIRLIGEDSFNDQIRERMDIQDFGPITTILQVRYDAWAEVHPGVVDLTNMDFIDLKTVGRDERYHLVLEKLGIGAGQTHATGMREAFERYYARGINSGSLKVFGSLLERLVKGELINEAHTARLLDHMENITTGDKRIKAGLPEGTPFAQKTGTQVARACNVGVLHPRDPAKAVVVTACVEGHDDLADAEAVFRQLGQALTEAGLARAD